MRVTGKDLIEMGFEQSAELGAALAIADQHGLEGVVLRSAHKPAAAVCVQMEQFGLADVADEIMPFGRIMARDCERDAPWCNNREARNG